MRELTFHVVFSEIYKKFMGFACYFRTTWMPDETVFEMYGLLVLLLGLACKKGGSLCLEVALMHVLDWPRGMTQ